MVGSRIVCCSKCGKELFYLADNYKMSMKIICVGCGNGKKIKTKTAATATVTANYARTKKGIRQDIHPTYSFKSATEANFARILQYLGATWKYEERAFTFDGYKNKPHIYVIDFEIVDIEKNKTGLGAGWIEVKGYMDARSRNKLRRLKAKYPDDAAKTMIIIYNHGKKADIEFCEKLGYKYLFYDRLAEEYEPKIPTWE